MKKEKSILLIAGIGIIMTVYLLLHSFNIREQNVQDNFIPISVERVEEVIAQKKNSVIYCGQDTCSACRSFEPILKKVVKDTNIDIYYLDVDLISNQKGLEPYKIMETPTLIVIGNENTYVYRGTLSEEDIRKAITNTKINIERVEGIVPIQKEELDLKMNAATDFILYIGREDCRDCKEFMPILKDYFSANNGIGTYYLDIKKYREASMKNDATQEDIQMYESIREQYNIKWVPTLLHIRNGIEVARYEYLDAEYGQLDEKEKINRKDEFVQEFYNWIEKETMIY